MHCLLHAALIRRPIIDGFPARPLPRVHLAATPIDSL
jgi:hypothetical protein